MSRLPTPSACCEENIALNGYQVTAVRAAAGDHCGTARFTAGLDAGNSLAPDGPAVTDLVTVDSLIGDRWVTGMKVDVEGFEIDVLRGAARALRRPPDRPDPDRVEPGVAVRRRHRPPPGRRAARRLRLPALPARPDRAPRPGRRSRVRRRRLRQLQNRGEPAHERRAQASQPAAVRSHRTPRYVYHRTRQLCYERAHPDEPWLTPAAIGLLATLLRPADTGAEFGSGRSTLWFAARVAALTSVEHDTAVA